MVYDSMHSYRSERKEVKKKNAELNEAITGLTHTDTIKTTNTFHKCARNPKGKWHTPKKT